VVILGDMDEMMNGFILELRRGTLILSVLSQLEESQYGYSLVQSLSEKGISIDPGTLYPLLRRLEKQGILESKWEVTETRPRRYYTLSATGREIYKRLCDEWERMVESMNRLINDNKGEA